MATDGVTLKEARAAKPAATEAVARLVGQSVAVGIVPLGSGRYALKINLTEKPSSEVQIPTDVNGVPVKVEVIGRIRKRA